MYVTADQNFVSGFVGGISPMLTVWRKLHLEFDSMTAPPSTGPEANFVSGTVFGVQQNYPVPGRSRVKVAHAVEARPDNRFEHGKLEIPGVGAYAVLQSFTFVGQVQFVTYLDVQTVVPMVRNETAVKVYDDDDQFLTDDLVYRSNLQMQSPQVPADGRSGEFTSGITPAYAVAYILPVDARAFGFNNQRTIAFKRNAGIGLLMIIK